MPAESRIEQIARQFHEVYERLAPEYGYRTRDASAVPWAQVPDGNKLLMRATVADLILRGVIVPGTLVRESLLDATETTRAEHLPSGELDSNS